MAYRTIDALKKLAVKVTSATSAADVTGETVDDVIAYMEANFVTKEKGDTGDKGDTGAAGASVTAIELETTEGAVTGGTATLSDGTEITITVTEAE